MQGGFFCSEICKCIKCKNTNIKNDNTFISTKNLIEKTDFQLPESLKLKAKIYPTSDHNSEDNNCTQHETNARNGLRKNQKTKYD